MRGFAVRAAGAIVTALSGGALTVSPYEDFRLRHGRAALSPMGTLRSGDRGLRLLEGRDRSSAGLAAGDHHQQSGATTLLIRVPAFAARAPRTRRELPTRTSGRCRPRSRPPGRLAWSATTRWVPATSDEPGGLARAADGRTGSGRRHVNPGRFSPLLAELPRSGPLGSGRGPAPHPPRSGTAASDTVRATPEAVLPAGEAGNR